TRSGARSSSSRRRGGPPRTPAMTPPRRPAVTSTPPTSTGCSSSSPGCAHPGDPARAPRLRRRARANAVQITGGVMGADIHGFLEYRVGDRWFGIDDGWHPGRDYELFPLLANVRGQGALYPPRGIPRGASDL